MIKAYSDNYDQANGQETKKRLELLEANRAELETATKGIQMQIHAADRSPRFGRPESHRRQGQRSLGERLSRTRWSRPT